MRFNINQSNLFSNLSKIELNAIELNDSKKTVRRSEWCIGCGVCAHFCQENATSLLEEMRNIYIPLPKFRN